MDEISLYNWNKCIDGDLKYIRKNIKKGNNYNDLIYWEKLHDLYIQEYGLNVVKKRLLEQMKKVGIAELNYIITGDRFQLTLIEMEQQKLENMLKSANTGITLEQGLIHISKWIGYPLKTQEISVKFYFNVLKEYERFNKITNGKEIK